VTRKEALIQMSKDEGEKSAQKEAKKQRIKEKCLFGLVGSYMLLKGRGHDLLKRT